MSSVAPSHILVVGAGAFGLSTVLSLLSNPTYSSTHITILDASSFLPNPSGSSVDSNRIIRADYASRAYAVLATEAQVLWRDTSVTGWGGGGRYYEPGLVLVADSGLGAYVNKSYENVKNLAESCGFPVDASKIERLYDADDLRRASGCLDSKKFGDCGYANWNSGWADAEAGVRYALARIRSEGADRVSIRPKSHVTSLLFDSTSNKDECTGVTLATGENIHADLTILATGAWTPALLPLEGICLATGQVIAYTALTDTERQTLQDRPTVLSLSRGCFIIPPRTNELKIARHAFGYLNPQPVTFSSPTHAGTTTSNSDHNSPKSTMVSVPSVGRTVPEEGQIALRTALSDLLPSLADRPFSRTRICWYCDTPTGDFLIDYHPQYKNLFVATGGSGHGFKFFPVIGDKIVDCIAGNLNEAYRRLWAWREPVADFRGCDDGSRSGQKGMILEDLR